jgi:hypothetical protein
MKIIINNNKKIQYKINNKYSTTNKCVDEFKTSVEIIFQLEINI